MTVFNFKCIFCLATDQNLFNTIEHIIPESLGGEAILPKGMFCDKCQSIFGSEIEQQALATYPLINFRTFFGVPTKKGKNAWFSSWEGRIEGSGIPGSLIYEPNKYFWPGILSGQKTRLSTIAMVGKPEMLLRTLLKIGLKVYALNVNSNNIYLPKFDAARKYALKNEKDYPWFFIMIEDIDKLNLFLKNITYQDWLDNFFAEIIEFESGIINLHLKLLYLDFIVPLVENVLPSEDLKASMKEPKERIFIID